MGRTRASMENFAAAAGSWVVKLVGWSLGLRLELKGDPPSSKANQIPLNLSLPHLKVLTLHPPVSREAGSCMGENRTLNDPTDSDCRRDHCRPRARGSGHIHFRKWLSALVTGAVNGAIFVGAQAYLSQCYSPALELHYQVT
jgi:hypothetical protein